MEPWRISFARRGFGVAWTLLCATLALHILDLWAHDFLDYYNATALTLYGHFSWFPRIDLSSPEWLTIVILSVTACAALTPFALRNVKWFRPLAYLFAMIQVLYAMGIVTSEILGGTVPSVRFDGHAPGLYTAPLLIAASGYLLWQLRQTRRPELPRTNLG